MCTSNQEKVKKWIGEYGPVARAIIARKVFHAQDREDLFQEWVLRVYRLSDGNGVARILNPGAFLATIARNVVADYCERRSKNRLVVITDLGGLEAADPQDSFAGLQFEDILDELRRRVKPVIADAFLLVYRRRYTHREAAKELGRSESMIRRYVEKCESLFYVLAGEPVPGCNRFNAPARGHAAGCPSNPPSSDAGPVQ